MLGKFLSKASISVHELGQVLKTKATESVWQILTTEPRGPLTSSWEPTWKKSVNLLLVFEMVLFIAQVDMTLPK